VQPTTRSVARKAILFSAHQEEETECTNEKPDLGVASL
jgi:hypothetical protein